MEPRRWRERLLGSTRGRIIALLRRSERTVNDLAEELGLTDNAVRAHLAGLERDGLAAMSGVRRGGGKPAHLYALTPEAEGLFPKAYGLVLAALLDVLRARLPGEDLDALVREAGRRLGAAHPPAGGGARERAEAAVHVLAELGGVAEAHPEGGVWVIEGLGCPLRDAVGGHAEVCRLAAALLAEVVGQPVRECCDRGPLPRCRFEVAHVSSH
ncbi:MAG TPA: ArsR family transcriptional regulator [Longimicrobiaceae bacterium]|nr:ArsR family transcriptional regulator [Longimicrobiaceae bacterium]